MVTYLAVEDVGTVRVITLNRPQAKNAMHAPMRNELVEALVATDADETVSAVVLTGSGSAFSAGVDFKLHDHPPAREAQFASNPAKAARSMRTPIVAAVNGACVSGGLELALSCSFIVAGASARFADTHARLGVVATWGLTALLPRAIGVRYATQMSLTGEFLDAHEALRIGLANRVLPDEGLLAGCVEIAQGIPFNRAVADLVDLYRNGENLNQAAAIELETSTSLRRAVDLEAFTKAGKSVSS